MTQTREKLFTEAMLIKLPDGTLDTIAAAAARWGITSSDYVREAVALRLIEDDIPVPEVLEQRRAHLPRRRC